jgi:hypothetical protein
VSLPEATASFFKQQHFQKVNRSPGCNLDRKKNAISG